MVKRTKQIAEPSSRGYLFAGSDMENGGVKKKLSPTNSRAKLEVLFVCL